MVYSVVYYSVLIVSDRVLLLPDSLPKYTNNCNAPSWNFEWKNEQEMKTFLKIIFNILLLLKTLKTKWRWTSSLWIRWRQNEDEHLHRKDVEGETKTNILTKNIEIKRIRFSVSKNWRSDNQRHCNISKTFTNTFPISNLPSKFPHPTRSLERFCPMLIISAELWVAGYRWRRRRLVRRNRPSRLSIRGTRVCAPSK